MGTISVWAFVLFLLVDTHNSPVYTEKHANSSKQMVTKKEIKLIGTREQTSDEKNFPLTSYPISTKLDSSTVISDSNKISIDVLLSLLAKQDE